MDHILFILGFAMLACSLYAPRIYTVAAFVIFSSGLLIIELGANP